MKVKSILLIVLTLLIGFVLGMLTSAQIRLNKLKPVRLYFSEERFREGFYKIIEPDEKQKVEIEKILNKYAKENTSLQTDFRKQLDVNIKAFRKELDSKLTKEQLARLKEFDEKRQDIIRQGRRDRKGTPDSLNNRHPGNSGRDFHGDDGTGFRDRRPPSPGELPPPPPPPDSSVSSDTK
ncbi:MAG TPA: hypothetical protein PLV06_04530 [Bacteroidales bacterium]|nr:hypothetical protein [Bacteroidales bacterium]HPF03510.1 hypothetical protein [Bacteroidales bacterium]HPJ58454.1 hypothetical protein [Bacteroidales bacterium]HPR11629.1 hypothetical protein [Bacteroidales bacterium]HRW84990.1 hypothetical protein [Bacteroidales bacterium]